MFSDSSHPLPKDGGLLGGGDGHLHLQPLQEVDEQRQGGGGETQSENLLSASSPIRSSSLLTHKFVTGCKTDMFPRTCFDLAVYIILARCHLRSIFG